MTRRAKTAATSDPGQYLPLLARATADKVRARSFEEIRGLMAKSRSGTQWTEADYAARGYGRITLRLSRTVLELLAARAKESGKSRAEVVAELVLATRQP